MCSGFQGSSRFTALPFETVGSSLLRRRKSANNNDRTVISTPATRRRRNCILDRVAYTRLTPSVGRQRHDVATSMKGSPTPPVGGRAQAAGSKSRSDVRAEFDEPFSSKLIEVELQSILQADSMSRTRHCCIRSFLSEHNRRRLAKKSAAHIDVKN
jgi:hypothetical protein